MRLIVGIDLSLQCTGIAILTETQMCGIKLTTGVIPSTGKRKDTLITRHDRLTTIGQEVLHYCPGPGTLPADTWLSVVGIDQEEVDDAFAVIEGTTPGQAGGSVVDRYALWWFVVGGLIRRGVPVAVVGPSSMKKAITGNGRADKAAVAGKIKDLYPDLVITSSDVADACGLAHLGAVALGWDVKALASHRQVKWTEWPEDYDALGVA